MAGYLYHDEPKPKELRLLQDIKTFGVHAIMGRPVLTAREIKDFNIANGISALWNTREAMPDKQKWEEEYPDEADILNGHIIEEYKRWQKTKSK